MFIPNPAALCGSSHNLDQLVMNRIPDWANPGCYHIPAAADIVERLHQFWSAIVEWFTQPQVIAVLIVWVVTFAVTTIIVLGIGFGPVGVGAGSLAAAFQSCMYGGFTPAGGIFATLTSMAMLGTLCPAAFCIAAVFATTAAIIAWVCRAGG